MRIPANDCKQVNTLGYALSLFLSEDLSQSTKDFANDCFKKANYPAYYQYNEISFPKFDVEQIKVSSSLAKEMMEINIAVNRMKDIKSNKNRTELKNILKKLEQRNDFISKLMQAVVYYETGNSARGNRMLRYILKRPLHINTFLYQRENPRTELDGLYKSLLSKLSLLSKNRRLLNALFLKFVINGSPELVKYVKSELDVHDGENEIEDLVNSSIYGKSYPSTWIKFYLNGKSLTQVYQKLDASQYFENLKKENLWAAWILQFDLNIPKSEQDKITNLLQELQQSKNDYLKDMYFSIMANSKAKKLLENHDGGSKKPLFLEKRKFYQSLLKKSIAVEYALYQLIILGDEDLKYLSHLYEI